MAEETRVKVSIEADKATGAIAATGEELKKFGDQAKEAGEAAKKGAEGQDVMAEATDKLEEQLQALVGGAAIAAFFKGAVEASLEEAEALRVVRFQVEATGQSWDAYKDRIDRFAASQMALTEFEDGTTLQVLGRLARATGDVESAMRATALAQDIASATGKDLASTTDLINGLLTGQQRAVVQAQKEFKAYVGEADTTQTVLDRLAGSFEGAAVKQDGWAKSITQSKNALAEFQQRVGDGIVPVFAVLLRGVTMVTKGWEELATVIAGVAAAAGTAIAGIIEAMLAMNTLQFSKAKEVVLETKASVVTIAEETAAEIDAIEQRYNSDRTDRVTSSAALVAEKSIEEVNAVREAERRKVEERKKAEALTVKLEEERKKNFASTLSFIATLSNAKNKELALVGKAAGLASAYVNTAVAVTQALRSAPPPFNFALAAAVGAAGAVQIATIAGVQLEKGGVTTNTGQDGIFANIGEKGKPEAVLPLTDRAAMAMVGKAIAEARGGGGGGDTFILNLTVNAEVPEWRAIIEKLADEAANGGPEIIRLSRRMADLSELYAGRSA